MTPTSGSLGPGLASLKLVVLLFVFPCFCCCRESISLLKVCFFLHVFQGTLEKNPPTAAEFLAQELHGEFSRALRGGAGAADPAAAGEEPRGGPAPGHGDLLPDPGASAGAKKTKAMEPCCGWTKCASRTTWKPFVFLRSLLRWFLRFIYRGIILPGFLR